MKIVNDWGQLFRMSERKYKTYIIAGSEGKDPNASEYGKFIGVISFEGIDAKPKDFLWELERLRKKMKVGDFVTYRLYQEATEVGKGKIQEELTQYGQRAFRIKTPYGEVTTVASLCELLPKKNNCKT